MATPHIEALITFNAVGVRLFFAAGKTRFGSDNPVLIYPLKLGFGELLKLSSGEDTRSMQIILRVTTGQSTGTNAIGALHYIEKYENEFSSQPAHLVIEVDIPISRFDELVALARVGKYPSTINIQTLGPHYAIGGIAGEATEWDVTNEQNRKGAVSCIDFSIPLGGEPIEQALKETGSERNQDSAGEQARGIQSQLIGIRASMRWILILVMAILVLMIWRAAK